VTVSSATLCHAANADYRLLVVGDCCSDGDEEAHRVLLEKVGRPPSLMRWESRRPSGLGGRRRHCSVSIAPPGALAFLRRAGRGRHDGPGCQQAPSDDE
jgi:hypothetical protein